MPDVLVRLWLLAALSLPACKGGESPPVEPKPAAKSAEPARHAPVANWRIDVGANSPGTAESTVKTGPGTIELSGDASVGTWRMGWLDTDELPAAGDELILTFRARTEGIRRQGWQLLNANGVLAFFDGAGKRLALVGSTPLNFDTPWRRQSIVAVVPEGAERASAGFLLSLTGRMWVDRIALTPRKLVPWSRAVAGEAWLHLKRRVAELYPFEDLQAGLAAWNKRADALRAKAVAASDRDAFVAVMLELLGPLKDPHVVVQAGELGVPTVDATLPPQTWNLEALRAQLDGPPLLRDKEFIVLRLKGGIGYALLGSWQRGVAPVQRALAALDQLGDAKGLIIDVRPNQGGAEDTARLVANRFAKERHVYAKRRMRLGEGWGPWQEITTGPNPKADTRPVVVLQSRWCMSSNEGFLQMMRVQPHVTTLGAPSRGASRNPTPVQLTRDLAVKVSQWENALPDGTTTEYKGVPPEVLLDPPPAAYAKADPQLDKALELLRR